MSYASAAAGYLYRCAMIYGNQNLAEMQRDMDRIARGILPEERREVRVKYKRRKPPRLLCDEEWMYGGA